MGRQAKRITAAEREYKRLFSIAKNANRRASKLGTIGNVTAEHLQWCMKYWKEHCAVCGKESDHYCFDHWIPLGALIASGSTIDNLIYLCAACNMLKRDSDPEAWLKKRFGTHAAIGLYSRIQLYQIEAVRTWKL